MIVPIVVKIYDIGIKPAFEIADAYQIPITFFLLKYYILDKMSAEEIFNKLEVCEGKMNDLLLVHWPPVIVLCHVLCYIW